MSLTKTTAIELRYELAVDMTTASSAATTRPTSPTGTTFLTTVGTAWSGEMFGYRASATSPIEALTKKKKNAKTPDITYPLRAFAGSGVEKALCVYGGTSVSPSRKARNTLANRPAVQVPMKLRCASGTEVINSAGPPTLTSPIIRVTGRKTPRNTNCSMSVCITAHTPPNAEYRTTIDMPMMIPSVVEMPSIVLKIVPTASAWAPSIPAQTATERMPVRSRAVLP